jgi:parvulin-like peptidyl-prolyl isomerase
MIAWRPFLYRLFAMLDFLRRHHKTFWIVVTVVVIISFTFWGASTKTGNRAGYATPEDSAVTVYGRDYSHADVSRLIRYRQLAVSAGLYEFAQTMSYIAQRYSFKDRTPLDFVVNIVVLRNEMEKCGVRVSDAEAREAFRRLPRFQNKEGQFDGMSAQEFENDLGSMGFRVEDVYDMMRDYLGLQKLEQLVSGNVISNTALGDKFYAAAYQSIKASSIPFATDDFKKTANVSDDEIKKYYDQNKDHYKSSPMRSVSYVLFEKPKDLDKKSQEDRIKEQNKFSEEVNGFSVATINEPAKFAELAKQAKKEVHTVPLFAQDSPPDALKEEAALIADIFSNDPSSHPVSDPVEGKNGYFIYKVDKVEEPKQQELKDVQAKIKETLVAQKAQEAMMKAASDMRKKLDDAVKGGKKFEDAAKQAGVTPQSIPEFTPSEPPKGLSNGPEIAEETGVTPAGGFTKPLPTEHGVILLYVQSKVIYKNDDSAKRKERTQESLTTISQRTLFQAWFDRRKDEANSVPHIRNL